MDKSYIASELKTAAREMQAWGFDFPPEIERLERKFESAIQDILSGISDYQDVMEKLARFDEYPDAVEIGQRGAKTAKQRYESWHGIADDFHVLASKMERRERDTGSYMASAKTAADKEFAYGHKVKWGSLFLTAFSLDTEDVAKFANKFNKELQKESRNLARVRLWRIDEDKDGRSVIIGWYGIDHPDFEERMGDPDYYMMELVDVAMYNTRRSLGYTGKAKDMRHSAYVKLVN